MFKSAVSFACITQLFTQGHTLRAKPFMSTCPVVGDLTSAVISCLCNAVHQLSLHAATFPENTRNYMPSGVTEGASRCNQRQASATHVLSRAGTNFAKAWLLMQHPIRSMIAHAKFSLSCRHLALTAIHGSHSASLLLRTRSTSCGTTVLKWTVQQPNILQV